MDKGSRLRMTAQRLTEKLKFDSLAVYNQGFYEWILFGAMAQFRGLKKGSSCSAGKHPELP
jgi:predicted lipoprotein